MRRAAYVQHLLEADGRVIVDQQLPWIAAAFLHDGGRLAPDQFGAAGAETFIAAKHQFVGLAVERPVAAFHRLDGKGVADAIWTNLYGAKQRFEILGETNVQPEPLDLGIDFSQGMKLEVVCHVEVSVTFVAVNEK